MKNALTVDVEDYFHVTAFESVISPADWDRYPLRVSDNTRRILDLFDRFAVKGTFFILGWVAERDPGLVREIRQRGHEIACHGYGHRLIYRIGAEAFRTDVRRAKTLLEGITGEPVIGYRAPSYSITGASLWALDIRSRKASPTIPASFQSCTTSTACPMLPDSPMTSAVPPESSGNFPFPLYKSARYGFQWGEEAISGFCRPPCSVEFSTVLTAGIDSLRFSIFIPGRLTLGNHVLRERLPALVSVIISTLTGWNRNCASFCLLCGLPPWPRCWYGFQRRNCHNEV